jgi:hypothetical protein
MSAGTDALVESDKRTTQQDSVLSDTATVGTAF